MFNRIVTPSPSSRRRPLSNLHFFRHSGESRNPALCRDSRLQAYVQRSQQVDSGFRQNDGFLFVFESLHQMKISIPIKRFVRSIAAFAGMTN